jgi:hypothetical protein
VNLREALEAVRASYGTLTPEHVVEAARAREDEAGELLHGRLEWDDEAAGEKWRRRQAHELIQSVTVVTRKAQTGERFEVRAYHALQDERTGGYAYEPAEEVAMDPVKRQMLLQRMEWDVAALWRRWETWREFSDLVRERLGEAASV